MFNMCGLMVDLLSRKYDYMCESSSFFEVVNNRFIFIVRSLVSVVEKRVIKEFFIHFNWLICSLM